MLKLIKLLLIAIVVAVASAEGRSLRAPKKILYVECASNDECASGKCEDVGGAKECILRVGHDKNGQLRTTTTTPTPKKEWGMGCASNEECKSLRCNKNKARPMCASPL